MQDGPVCIASIRSPAGLATFSAASPWFSSVETKAARYGNRRGKHVSPVGTAFGKRSIPEVQRFAIRRVYVVKKPITVRSGEVAPGVGQVGGGVQHYLPKSVIKLQLDGSLERRLW